MPEISDEEEDVKKEINKVVEAGRDNKESNEDFIPVATKSNKEIGTEQFCSEKVELIQTLSRIGPAKIERTEVKQENVSDKRIMEASNQDETSNLAADIFRRDFAMFAKDHMLMIKPEPEKNAIEKLKVLDNVDINDARKAELLRDIVTTLKEDMPNLFQEAYNHSDPVL